MASSEGSHIPPNHFHRSGTPSSLASASETAAAARRAERETAHRSAPAASKQYQPHYALHRDEPFLPPRFPTEQPANYRDSIVSIVDDPFFQRFDDYAGEGAHGFEPLRTPTLHDPNPEDDNEQDDEHEEIGATQKYEITQEFDFDFDFGYFELRDDDNPNERWPPPRRESLIIGPSLSWVNAPPNTDCGVADETGSGKKGADDHSNNQPPPPLSPPPSWRASTSPSLAHPASASRPSSNESSVCRALP
ncbi:hypothetical protein CBS470a_000621 [Colletotrichum nupharicola]|nr:hypothetical protein CBS470a_000621 [Colletotrichum nupharicola]